MFDFPSGTHTIRRAKWRGVTLRTALELLGGILNTPATSAASLVHRLAVPIHFVGFFDINSGAFIGANCNIVINMSIPESKFGGNETWSGYSRALTSVLTTHDLF